MRKIFTMMLIGIMLFSFSACKSSTGGSSEQNSTSQGSIQNDASVTDSRNEDAGSSLNQSSLDTSNNSSTDKTPSKVEIITEVPTTSGEKKKLANPVSVASGTSSMTNGLNFGGKTFNMALPTDPMFQSASFKRIIYAFEKEFNCKVTTTTIAFNDYNKTLAASIGNKIYDICFAHGSQFPSNIISNLYQDLTPYFTTADIDDGSGKGGIDLEKTSYNVYNNKLYGLVNCKSVYPILIYYNKKLFNENGLKDPYELYKSGQWTWNEFRSMGKSVTDSSKGIYFGSAQYSFYSIFSYGVAPITYKNGNPVVNIKDDNFINGLKLAKVLCYGKNAICQPKNSYTGDSAWDGLYTGLHFTAVEESQKWEEVASEVKKSQAFGKSIANLGVVPLPQSKIAAKRGYPTGWTYSVAAGANSKTPEAAVAFSIFWSRYVEPVKDDVTMPDEYKKLVYELLTRDNIFEHGDYSNASTRSLDQVRALCGDVVERGMDMTKAIEDRMAIINDCIKQTMK